MAQSIAQLHVHMVFAVRERRPLLRDAFRAQAHAYLAGILRNLGCHVHAIGGTADHVHLCFDLARTISIADVAEKLKANSSRWVNQEGHERDFGWQGGYGAFSVSTSLLPKVIAYIERQEAQHRRMDFKTELEELCRKHGVEVPEFGG